jgi:hypothetical protein
VLGFINELPADTMPPMACVDDERKDFDAGLCHDHFAERHVNPTDNLEGVCSGHQYLLAAVERSPKAADHFLNSCWIAELSTQTGQVGRIGPDRWSNCHR